MSIECADRPVTKVIVPGRSHQVMADGSLELSDDSVARVEAVANYYHAHADYFAAQGGRILFEGGWAKAAGGLAKPPEAKREGRLMRLLGLELGIPEDAALEGIESTSTMTNFLDARKHFLYAARLAIVTQHSHAARLAYCGNKALPGTELSFIFVAGQEGAGVFEDEERLLKQSRLLYGWAGSSPMALRFADNVGTLAGNLIGLKPASKYSNAT